ncbi:MAG: ATP synthase F0 subunit B [Roseburia sp.]|nr:ATP synthase F0 subunit B [Roseburia sp.]
MNLPLNIDLQQIFLHLFNFVILAGGLYLLLYKPVKDFMDKRAAYYENLDKEAKAKLEEAEQLNAVYREQLKEVDKEIAKNRAKAVKELQDQCDSELQTAKKQAAKLIANAQIEAEHERARILADTQKEIAGMAVAATKKLLYRSVTDTYDQFLAGAEGSVGDE